MPARRPAEEIRRSTRLTGPTAPRDNRQGGVFVAECGSEPVTYSGCALFRRCCQPTPTKREGIWYAPLRPRRRSGGTVGPRSPLSEEPMIPVKEIQASSGARTPGFPAVARPAGLGAHLRRLQLRLRTGAASTTTTAAPDKKMRRPGRPSPSQPSPPGRARSIALLCLPGGPDLPDYGRGVILARALRSSAIAPFLAALQGDPCRRSR